MFASRRWRRSGSAAAATDSAGSLLLRPGKGHPSASQWNRAVWSPAQPLRASLTALPAVNLATFDAAIVIGAPVWGLRPWRSPRSKVPKPAMRTSSPRFQRLHGLAAIGPGQAGVLRDGRDQVCLVHECGPPLKRLPTQATGPSRANRLTGRQHPYADKPACQGSFQAVVAPGLHCGGTVAPVIGAPAAQDLGTALGAQAAGEASSGNAGSRLAKKSP